MNPDLSMSAPGHLSNLSKRVRGMTCKDYLHQYRVEILLTSLLLLCLYGNILAGMAVDWYRDANYAHGFLVPFIAGYFVYQRRSELADSKVATSAWGGLLMFVALAQLVVGTLMREQFTVRTSLILLCMGIVLYLGGIQVFRLLLLPTGYLLFMVPLPYLIHDAVAFPLRQFVAMISVGFMQVIGLTVLREGNIIMFPAFSLEVADACSGIRSLISILALSVAFAFLLRLSPLWRWLLVLSAVPVAVATNALRVILTGVLGRYLGVAAAQGFFHEFAGLTIFALAMALLGGFGLLLQRRTS